MDPVVAIPHPDRRLAHGRGEVAKEPIHVVTSPCREVGQPRQPQPVDHPRPHRREGVEGDRHPPRDLRERGNVQPPGPLGNRVSVCSPRILTPSGTRWAISMTRPWYREPWRVTHG